MVAPVERELAEEAMIAAQDPALEAFEPRLRVRAEIHERAVRNGSVHRRSEELEGLPHGRGQPATAASNGSRSGSLSRLQIASDAAATLSAESRRPAQRRNFVSISSSLIGLSG